MNDVPADREMGRRRAVRSGRASRTCPTMPSPASKRKFLFLFCSRSGLRSKEAKYFQYVVGKNGDVRALPTQLGLIEGDPSALTAIGITAACRKLIMQFAKICLQIAEKYIFFGICSELPELRSRCRTSQQIWKISRRAINPGDGSIELQKKRLNILKALKRAQKCAPPIRVPPRFTYCSACGRQSDESSCHSS